MRQSELSKRAEARRKAVEEDAEGEKLRAKHDAEREQRARDAEPWLRTLHPASAFDYTRWLNGYLDNGGTITHVYDHPMRDVLRATEDVTVTPLYGASSVDILIPEGVACYVTELGHNNVYRMDGFTCDSGHVPLYKDT